MQMQMRSFDVDAGRVPSLSTADGTVLALHKIPSTSANELLLYWRKNVINILALGC
jgi:hypothetical protein